MFRLLMNYRTLHTSHAILNNVALFIGFPKIQPFRLLLNDSILFISPSISKRSIFIYSIKLFYRSIPCYESLYQALLHEIFSLRYLQIILEL